MEALRLGVKPGVRLTLNSRRCATSSSSSSRFPSPREDFDSEDEDVFERRRRLYLQTKHVSTEDVGIQRINSQFPLQRRRRQRLFDDDEDDVEQRATFDLELLLLGFPILLVASPALLAHPLASLVALTALFTLPGSGKAMRSIAREAAALSSSRSNRKSLPAPRGDLSSRALPRGGRGSGSEEGGAVFDPRRRRRQPRTKDSLPAAATGAPTATAATTTTTTTTTQQQNQPWRPTRPLPRADPPSQERR